jgi:hypothetical protein
MKVETDIIASSLIERAVTLVIMFIDSFKISVIVFISNVIMDITPTNNFQYQSQSVDTENNPR